MKNYDSWINGIKIIKISKLNIKDNQFAGVKMRNIQQTV